MRVAECVIEVGYAKVGKKSWGFYGQYRGFVRFLGNKHVESGNR